MLSLGNQTLRLALSTRRNSAFAEHSTLRLTSGGILLPWPEHVRSSAKPTEGANAADPTSASRFEARVRSGQLGHFIIVGRLLFVRRSRRCHGNFAEVEMGQLAKKQASSDGVRAFGEMLEKDHSAANQKATAAATSLGTFCLVAGAF
jgi:predicted outer membrane protein